MLARLTHKIASHLHSITIGLALLLTLGSGAGLAQTETPDKTPVEFSADQVSSNSETGVMTASGNVIITQGNKRLTADRIEYNRNIGKAIATGAVVFKDSLGNTHYAETLTLEENFSHAIAEPVISKFADGAWLAGGKITHKQNLSTQYQDARYTPCDCDFVGGETPAWEINSTHSRHDPKTKTIYHKNVTMRLFSIPVLYFPYLHHPDWTVRRHSGLLPPRVSISSDLGTTYSQSYYWVTGDTHDLEITPHFFGNKGIALKNTYRQNWDQSSLEAIVYGGHLSTYKKNRENVAGIDAKFNTILGQGWDTQIHLYRASQDTFMRRYNFDDTEVLKSSFTTQKVDGDRYSHIEAYDIQDLKSDRNPDDEATVLPSVFHERYLETSNENLQLRLRLSALQLDNDEATDLKRWSSEIYAREDFAADFGNLSVEARLAGQYRNIETAPNNTDPNNTSYEGELGQLTLAAGLGWSQPISVIMAGRTAVIEPRLKLVTVKSTDRSRSIPNRDSSDFRLDEANLFLLHREQGEDYNITSTRIDGGVSMSLYDDYLGDVSGFIGSSMRLAGETPTGLNRVAEPDRISDILANLSIQPHSTFNLSMAWRFHPRNFTRNETSISGALTLDKTHISGTYNQLSSSYFDIANEGKEELIISARQDFAYKWSLKATQKYDLMNSERRLVDSSINVNYGGGLQDCLNISIGYNRDTKRDRDIRPINEVFIVFNFKNLGTVGTTDAETSPFK